MDQPPPFSLASPAALGVAVALVILAAVAALFRRPDVPRLTHAFVAFGMLLLALAAGGPTWHRPAAVEVAVMVDLSPSTRTADYRDPMTLRRRVVDLLGAAPYRITYFAAGPASQQPADEAERGQALADLPADRTVYTPPAAAPAVVLFSDGRFELPAWAPPTYVVVDPRLDAPVDGAVERLELRPGEVSVTTRNTGAPRALTLSGTTPRGRRSAAPGAGSGADGNGRPAAGMLEALDAPPGTLVTVRPVAPNHAPGASVVARLAAGDAWPENDALTAFVPPPDEAERWWVGRSSPPGPGWRTFGPSDLPTDPAAYLAPSVIAFDNVPADALAELVQQRLTQYVRDLGGGVILLGGDAAFAAGEYAGTPLDDLSPLASTPPEPSAHWVVLVDSSGSMSAPAAGGPGATRFRVAADAAAGLVRSLPPNDRISVGGFAGGVRWWGRNLPAADASRQTIPPAGTGPTGPTELRRAIEEAVAAAEPSPPAQLVVLTDASADLSGTAQLAEVLRRKNVRFHLLVIGDAAAGEIAPQGLAALRQLVEATGGTLLAEDDPSRWAAAARRLLRGVTPDLLRRDPARLAFAGDLAALPPRDVAPSNRTWLKPAATSLGVLSGADGAEEAPGVARWQVGEGSVLAAAFPKPTSPELSEFLRLVARPPRDPRLRVTWDAGPVLRVAVDATEGARYLNGLSFSLHLADPSQHERPPQVHAVPQTAPGRYEASVDAPRSPSLGTLRLGGATGRAVGRSAVAGRYAPEFDAVGNDRRAMHDLAERTGGAVIEPSARGPLALPRPARPVPLAAPLAGAGAACVGLGLIRWRWS